MRDSASQVFYAAEADKRVGESSPATLLATPVTNARYFCKAKLKLAIIRQPLVPPVPTHVMLVLPESVATVLYFFLSSGIY
jgi:hypothetical protein